MSHVDRHLDEIWSYVYALPGVTLRAVEHDGTGRDIEVIAETDDPAALRTLLDERYGPGVVALVRVGARPPARRAKSFAGWEVDGAGVELTVYFVGGSAESDYVLAIQETADAVTVRLDAEVAAGRFAAVGFTREVSGVLRSPLGERSVVDGKSGVVRPRGRRYE